MLITTNRCFISKRLYCEVVYIVYIPPFWTIFPNGDMQTYPIPIVRGYSCVMIPYRKSILLDIQQMFDFFSDHPVYYSISQPQSLNSSPYEIA